MQLLTALRWDWLRLRRYGILWSSLLVTALFAGVLIYLRPWRIDLLVALVFSEPAGLGLSFIGAIYLYERSENTLQAQSVIPLRASHYLLSKVLALTGISMFTCLILAVAGYGWSIGYGYLLAGMGLSAGLFTLMGFGLVLRCRSFNEYMMKMGAVMPVLLAPLLRLFGLLDSAWFYLLPTQGSLLLLQAAFSPPETWQVVYALLYLCLWNALGYWLVMKAFQTQRENPIL